MTSPAAITVRPARSEDGPGIAALAGELGSVSDAPPSSGNLPLVLAHQDHVVYVAAKGNTILGWIHAFVRYQLQSQAFVEIGGLVVSAERRRGGIGARLIAAILAWARGLGVAEVRVRAREEREEAIAFYTRQGFTPRKKQLVLCSSPHLG